LEVFVPSPATLLGRPVPIFPAGLFLALPLRQCAGKCCGFSLAEPQPHGQAFFVCRQVLLRPFPLGPCFGSLRLGSVQRVGSFSEHTPRFLRAALRLFRR
jgi:hypothetical protein